MRRITAIAVILLSANCDESPKNSAWELREPDAAVSPAEPPVIRPQPRAELVFRQEDTLEPWTHRPITAATKISFSSWRTAVYRSGNFSDPLLKDIINVFLEHGPGSRIWVHIDEQLLGQRASFECMIDPSQGTQRWDLGGGDYVTCEADMLRVEYADVNDPRPAQMVLVNDGEYHVGFSKELDGPVLDVNFDHTSLWGQPLQRDISRRGEW